jgi:hypothetical protein
MVIKLLHGGAFNMTRTICNSAAHQKIGCTKLLGLLLITGAFIFTSCASTKITSSWKDKEYQGKAEKFVVIMVARTPEMRNMFEGRFVAELRARGNKAVQSYELVDLEQLPDRELVKSRIQGTAADTVLISRLIDSKTIQSYMPGSVQSQINIYPSHYYGWGTYYEVIFVDYGYTGDTQVAYIETNLYDMKTEKLIWSAQTETERTEGEQQLVNKFIDVILKKLSKDKIIN